MSGIQRMQRPIVIREYSGSRLAEYQRISEQRRLGEIDRNQFRRQIQGLNVLEDRYKASLEKQRQRRAEKREELRIAREVFEREYAKQVERQRRAEMDRLAEEGARRMVEQVRREREEKETKRKAQAEARKATSKFRNTILYDQTFTSSATFFQNEDRLYNACKSLVGKNSCYLRIVRNGDAIVSKIIDIGDSKQYDIYYDLIRPNLFENGSEGETIFTNNAVCRIILSMAQEIPSKRILQAFREGEKHCVLEPLYRLFMEYVKNSDSASSKKRYTTIANRMQRLMTEYENGVPEDKMEEVAKSAYRCIIIYDVLGNEIKRYNKLSPKIFHFTNTRENHLDVGHITMDKQYTSVSQDELNQIMLQHDMNNEFYLFRGNYDTRIPQSIRSANGSWAVFNDDYEIFQEFNKTIGVRNYRIDAVKYPVLNNFIKDGTIVHSGAVALNKSPNDLDNVVHYDMEKAYTQHNVSPYFNGFLGHIQQWAMLSDKDLDFVRSHIGMYRFRVIENTTLLRKLGMRVGNEYTLASPELLYMCDVLGLVVELVAGCWGTRAEIKYTPEMLEKRRYCTWAGKLGMETQKDVYMFKGSYEWACHLKSEIGEDRVSFWGDFICVKNPKKTVFTSHHLFAFITAYSRINMMEMMRRVDGELVKVVLDGIYFRGSMNTEGLKVAFSNDKKLIEHKGFSKGWYQPSSTILDWSEYAVDLDGSCVLAGAGGTGKSFRVFNDKTIYQPLYVVPSHLLGRKFRQQYGCSYTTIHKLIGMDCRPYGEENGHPHNIFMDELTMMDKEWVEKAISMYPESRFYIAGDIDGKQWYQCRNGSAEKFSDIWIPSREEWRYVDFTKDMRSKDEELRVFKEDIRSLMRNVFTDGGCDDAHRINNTVRNLVKTVAFGDAIKMFSRGDVWIAGTHKTNRRLLEAGVVSGWINNRKEAVFAEKINSIDEWVEEKEGEKRGSFTVHSFQGLTISDKKVFVSLDMFEYAMFYTAISRVCHFNQLVIVA